VSGIFFLEVDDHSLDSIRPGFRADARPDFIRPDRKGKRREPRGTHHDDALRLDLFERAPDPFDVELRLKHFCARLLDKAVSRIALDKHFVEETARSLELAARFRSAGISFKNKSRDLHDVAEAVLGEFGHVEVAEQVFYQIVW